MRIGPCRAPKAFWILCGISGIVVSFISFICFHSDPSRPCKCPPCPRTHSSLLPSLDEITFISVPPPTLKPGAYNRTKLAISSWLASSTFSKVLLFVNRTEFDPSEKLPNELDQLFGRGRVIYGGQVKPVFGGDRTGRDTT